MTQRDGKIHNTDTDRFTHAHNIIMHTHVLKPLSHRTGLAKWMETEQSPLKYVHCPFSIQLAFGIYVPCPSTLSKYFVPFHG